MFVNCNTCMWVDDCSNKKAADCLGGDERPNYGYPRYYDYAYKLWQPATEIDFKIEALPVPSFNKLLES